MTITVNADDSVRAENDRMFHDLQRDAGGVTVFSYTCESAAIDKLGA